MARRRAQEATRVFAPLNSLELTVPIEPHYTTRVPRSVFAMRATLPSPLLASPHKGAPATTRARRVAASSSFSSAGSLDAALIGQLLAGVAAVAAALTMSSESAREERRGVRFFCSLFSPPAPPHAFRLHQSPACSVCHGSGRTPVRTEARKGRASFLLAHAVVPNTPLTGLLPHSARA